MSGFSGFLCVFGSQLAQTQSVVATSSGDLALGWLPKPVPAKEVRSWSGRS